MEKHLWITVGVSGSGKTTWAREQQASNMPCHIICRDDVRVQILAEKKSRHPSEFRWKDWKWKWEKEVDVHLGFKFDAAIKNGHNVILADTNLSDRNYRSILDRFQEAGYLIHFQYFPIDWDTAIERNAHRANGVSYSVLQQQFEKWNKLFPEFAPFKNKGHIDSVIVDIDGTVALMGSRGPYDWHRVGEDEVNYHVVDIVKSLSRDYEIIFMSGRDGSCREQTVTWLDNTFPNMPYELFMRTAGDQRKDNIVKRELLNLVDSDFYIAMVIDDRPQVCRMWRQIGLNVVQVADPYKEF